MAPPTTVVDLMDRAEFLLEEVERNPKNKEMWLLNWKQSAVPEVIARSSIQLYSLLHAYLHARGFANISLLLRCSLSDV